MAFQNYEEYWKITLEYTDFNDIKFITTLKLLVEKIDEIRQRGDNYVYDTKDYQELQNEVLAQINKTSDNIENQLASTRKAINQCIKLGFVNPKFESYHVNTKDYIAAKTNQKRQTLFSKIVYSNAKFNSSMTKEHSWSQINFLIKTLEEIGNLTKKDLIALMTIDISIYEKNFVTENELKLIKENAEKTGFFKRKYNQIGYLNNILNKLDDIVFVKYEDDYKLYFEDDASVIFGEDYKKNKFHKKTDKRRDPYLHRIYKNQLKEESLEIYKKPICMLEKLSYPVLIASHIKPFVESNDIEAYDPNNGLLLSKTIDSLFDLKYISFSDEGKILFSKRISFDVKEFWKNYTIDSKILNIQRKSYLAFHRKRMKEIDDKFKNID